MSPSAIEILSELERAATPGPWYADLGINYPGGPEPKEPPTLEYWSDIVMGKYRIEEIKCESLEESADNAQFIALMRNKARALIEVARAAKICADTYGSSTLEEKFNLRMAALDAALAELEKP